MFQLYTSFATQRLTSDQIHYSLWFGLTLKAKVQLVDHKQKKTPHQTAENSKVTNFHQVDDSRGEIFRFVSAYL